VLKHAWGHIKESWRVALVGGVVTFVLPPLLQWWRTYDFSHKGLDEVTGGGWEWSVVALLVWLVLVATWHVLCAPMAHAREIISRLHGHHAHELERVREEAKAEAMPPPSVTNYNFYNLDEAAQRALVRQQELLQRRMVIQQPELSPFEVIKPQAADQRADDQAGGVSEP
jgi:hypothetical protein